MLTILLALSLLIASAGAAFAAGSGGKCGDNLTWTLSDDGVLTVSGEGPMKAYSTYPWAEAGEIRPVDLLVSGFRLLSFSRADRILRSVSSSVPDSCFRISAAVE